jgi:heptosyltransferase-2
LLQALPDARLLLIGGEADDEPLAHLQNAWNGRRVCLARDLPLPALAALLQRVRLFLGHDSGISHIAAAAGTRCVLLFGPTDPEVWAPPGGKVTVVRAPEGELGALDVEDVVRAVGSL